MEQYDNMGGYDNTGAYGVPAENWGTQQPNSGLAAGVGAGVGSLLGLGAWLGARHLDNKSIAKETEIRNKLLEQYKQDAAVVGEKAREGFLDSVMEDLGKSPTDYAKRNRNISLFRRLRGATPTGAEKKLWGEKSTLYHNVSKRLEEGAAARYIKKSLTKLPEEVAKEYKPGFWSRAAARINRPLGLALLAGSGILAGTGIGTMVGNRSKRSS